MSAPVSRRSFAALALGAAAPALTAAAPRPAAPVEAPFERDYDAPKFRPSWRKAQINRGLVQDFVVYAHMDLAMVKRLLDKEPLLVNAVMDWGGATGRAASEGRRTRGGATSSSTCWSAGRASTCSAPR